MRGWPGRVGGQHIWLLIFSRRDAFGIGSFLYLPARSRFGEGTVKTKECSKKRQNDKPTDMYWAIIFDKNTYPTFYYL